MPNSVGRTNAAIRGEDEFTFGRYEFTRDGLIAEAEEAGKPEAFISVLRSVKLSDLIDAARAEAAMNPMDDEGGWDETSQLFAAVSAISHMGAANLRTMVGRPR